MQYNETNVQNFYNNITSTQASTFASNITGHSLLYAFQQVFSVIDGQYQSDLGNVPSHMQAAFAEGMLHVADGVTNGYTMNVSGVSISNTHTSGDTKAAMDLHIDVVIVYSPGPIGFAFSFYHKHNVSNS